MFPEDPVTSVAKIIILLITVIIGQTICLLMVQVLSEEVTQVSHSHCHRQTI